MWQEATLTSCRLESACHCAKHPHASAPHCLCPTEAFSTLTHTVLGLLSRGVSPSRHTEGSCGKLFGRREGRADSKNVVHWVHGR